MYGNFVTLTNILNEDLKKIIKCKLEPLYISLHSLNENVRLKIFGNKNNFKGVENLKILDTNKIKTNIQIVLCPGINDGKDLTDTLLLLLKDFRNIISIGMVPVGITIFNKNDDLKPYKAKSSFEIINTVNTFKKEYKNFKGIDKIYLSDEFYIMAGMEFPGYKYYRNFYQIKNGIGKSTEFLRKINIFLNKESASEKIKNNKKNILIVTSEYGKKVIGFALRDIVNILGTKGEEIISNIRLLEIKNNFFKGNIKATGLLTGKDIMSGLNKESMYGYEKVIIPDSIFNRDNFTIDNYSRKDIKNISRNIKIISEEGSIFMKEIIS